MKYRPFAAIGGLIMVAIFGAIVWYLVSPLFINNVVDETFPFEIPTQAELAQMSETELEQMKADFLAVLPSQTQISQMSEEERAAVEAKVMQAVAIMPDQEVGEAIPDTASQPQLIRQGQFKDADSFHKGSGTATVYQLRDDTYVLRLEDFTVTNGPDLHVLLATSTAPISRADLGEYIDLGSLKGNLGNQNYEIPAGTDPGRYGSVVIYCMPFHVVFATASLEVR